MTRGKRLFALTGHKRSPMMDVWGGTIEPCWTNMNEWLVGAAV